jgi:alpha-N-acetylglucosaminidase
VKVRTPLLWRHAPSGGFYTRVTVESKNNWKHLHRRLGLWIPLAGIMANLYILFYREFGLTREDLDGFFAGPAWQPWQWMGNLDGWGGPLPQSVIEGQSELQKKILARARSLGMKPVLAGFSGHVPKALKRKIPDLKVHQLSWQGFPPTDTLDWEDPRFKEIGCRFLKKQQEIYGTDHYYAIDPFNEMTPPTMEKTYISNMAKLIFSSMDEADPEGTWVLMTWFCKSPQIPILDFCAFVAHG